MKKVHPPRCSLSLSFLPSILFFLLFFLSFSVFFFFVPPLCLHQAIPSLLARVSHYNISVTPHAWSFSHDHVCQSAIDTSMLTFVPLGKYRAVRMEGTEGCRQDKLGGLGSGRGLELYGLGVGVVSSGVAWLVGVA